MGSLNTDSTPISQSRRTIRNIGSAYVASADRREVETVRDESPETHSASLGTNADKATAQYTTCTTAHMVKTTTSAGDTLISEKSAERSTPSSSTSVIEGVQVGARHTGNRVVLSESIEDTTISRELDTGSYS